MVWWPVCVSCGVSGAHRGHDFPVYFPRFTSLQWFTVQQLIILWVSMSGGLKMYVHVCVCVCVRAQSRWMVFSSGGASAVPLRVFHLICTQSWCKHLSLWADRCQIEKSIYKTRDDIQKKNPKNKQTKKRSIVYIQLTFLHRFSFARYVDILTGALCEFCSALCENPECQKWKR